jgi:hypothetical protein
VNPPAGRTRSGVCQVIVRPIGCRLGAKLQAERHIAHQLESSEHYLRGLQLLEDYKPRWWGAATSRVPVRRRSYTPPSAHPRNTSAPAIRQLLLASRHGFDPLKPPSFVPRNLARAHASPGGAFRASGHYRPPGADQPLRRNISSSLGFCGRDMLTVSDLRRRCERALAEISYREVDSCT